MSSVTASLVPWKAEPAAFAAASQGACVIESVRELTTAVASGQPEALARLYDAWFDFALAEAHRCTGRDEQFCLDVVQETILRVIKRLKPLDSEGALAAWLRTAVRSAAIDLLRKDLRLQKRERRHAINRPETAVDDIAAQREIEDRLAWLREQLADIEPVTARALDLRFRLNWTLHRIGSALHMKTGAVDGRMNRAISQLRAAVQEDSHD